MSRCAPCRRYKTRKEAPKECQQECWMIWAFNPKSKGALHEYLGVPQSRKLPTSKLMVLAHDQRAPLHIRRRANLALVARGYRKKK